jgi:hypothetical protein
MARPPSNVACSWASLALLTLCGCGRPTPPGTLVGESEHFRLYVDPDVTVPPGLDGMNGLDALETEWADVHSMLQMPDGKITYYWISQDHVLAACGDADSGACIWEQSLEIDSPTLPNPHELNHAYMYLRKHRKPIPFLAEGIAEAIACDRAQSMYPADVPWEGVVGQTESSNDVTVQGGIFVRYLIRTYGVDAFLRYYEQSPEQRDPALFAANFQSFWHLGLDDVWTAIHELPPNIVPAAIYETKICPCSLPPLDPAGPVTNDPARAPYWPLPHPAGKTLALTADLGEGVLVKDCAGVRPALVGRGVLARLDGTEPRYVVAPLVTATVDSYLADTCADAAPYPYPPVDVATSGLAIAIPTPADSATFYINLASTFSGVLSSGLQEICADCGFDQGTCQPLGPAATPIMGPIYGMMTLYRSINFPMDVVAGSVEIYR